MAHAHIISSYPFSLIYIIRFSFSSSLFSMRSIYGHVISKCVYNLWQKEKHYLPIRLNLKMDRIASATFSCSAITVPRVCRIKPFGRNMDTDHRKRFSCRVAVASVNTTTARVCSLRILALVPFARLRQTIWVCSGDNSGRWQGTWLRTQETPTAESCSRNSTRPHRHFRSTIYHRRGSGTVIVLYVVDLFCFFFLYEFGFGRNISGDCGRV